MIARANRALSIALLSLAFALASCAGERSPRHDERSNSAEVDTAFRQLNKLQRQAAVLPGLLDQYIFYAAEYLRAHGVAREFLTQVLAALEAELGDYAGAESRYAQPAADNSANDSLPTTQDFMLSNADDAIADLARDRRIVMINEAHHIGETRLLTLKLLPRLRALGFTHFAAEGIDERDVRLAKRGYPIAATGPYASDPLYGEIIRRALALGFKVVAYESTDVNADAQSREADQAQHLLTRVFGDDAQARLFVHAGYAHIHKRSDEFFTDTLAMRLQRKTGFAPLSIDQTVLRPRADSIANTTYRDLLAHWPVRSPSVFIDKRTQAPWSLNPMSYDISVILPPTFLEYGRPSWLNSGERIRVEVPMPKGTAHFPWLVEARHDAEPDAAIPADRWLLREASRQAVLFLLPGEYRVRIQAADKRVVDEHSLHVVAAPQP